MDLGRHFNQPFHQSKPQTCQFSHLSGLNCFVDRRSKKTCAPLTAMWFWLAPLGTQRGIVIVLLKTSVWIFQNRTQSENLSVFYSATWVIENTIWFSKLKICEEIEIEKWRALFLVCNKKIMKIMKIDRRKRWLQHIKLLAKALLI